MQHKFNTLSRFKTKLNAIINNHQEGDIMKPGSYSNLSNDDYHSSEGLSNSGVSLILKCPYKYYYEYLSADKPDDEESTKALIIGQAIHTASLEPDFFNDRFTVLPEGIDRRTKIGKEAYAEFELASAGKVILRSDDFKMVQDMAKQVRSNKGFQNIINSETSFIEHSIFWNDKDTGALLKSRPDFFNHFMVLDLKSTESAREEDFKKSIFNYGYHRQAALGLDGLTQLTGWEYQNFVILAVEKKKPYLTALYLLDKATIDQGRREYKAAANTYQQCKNNNFWPAYPDKVIPIGLPTWAMTQDQNILTY